MACTHDNRKQICTIDPVLLWQCTDCGIVFSQKALEEFDPNALYNSYYYKNEIAGRFNLLLELVIRAFRFFRAFKIFTIAPLAKSILDIGSGRGFMLYYLKRLYGYRRAVGTQISRNAFEFSRDKLGLEMYDKDMTDLDFPESSFDIVTMWHVLEHVKEAEKYIEKISDIITEKGKLVIEVPNFDSWTRKFTGRYWLGLDIDYHLYFFTPNTLSALLLRHGFKIKTIHTFSMEYSAFISAQSIVSLLTRSDQIFFRYLQTGKINLSIIVHILLFLIVTPFCFLIDLLLYFSKKGEVLLVIADKS
jgi:SAM-dependent methyltransferase